MEQRAADVPAVLNTVICKNLKKKVRDVEIKKIVREMTLEEKCYLLSGKDFWQTRSVERLGIPNVTLSDGPHGIRKQEGASDQLGLNGSLPATCYPTAASIANSWDPKLGEERSEERRVGKECGS